MRKEPWDTISREGNGAEPGGVIRAEAHIDAVSPWFSGHFPDDPILPGIALLSLVSDVIKRHESEKGKRVMISGIRRVRFKLPVRPGTSLSITVFSPDDDGAYTFKIAVNGETACSGMMDCRALEQGGLVDACG
jgi:3-hydroxyacyl-[acyl-carrier-protein] dehydratase